MKVKIKTDDGHTISVTGPNADQLLDQLEEDLQELESHRRIAIDLLKAAKTPESWDNMREHILQQAEIMAANITTTFH